MADIPLFTNDFLSSPTMMGAISPTTARLMSETGSELIKNVEQNTAKLEAQAKAPKVAAMMGQGLTALSQGDMSGFSTIANARAMGASNPFLAKMTDDALSTGSHMAQSYVTNQLQKERLTNSDEKALEELDRQDNSAYNMAERQNLTARREREQVFNDAMSSHKKLVEKGISSEPPAALPPYQPLERPQFRSKAYGGPGATPAAPATGGSIPPSPIGGGSRRAFTRPTPEDVNRLAMNDTVVEPPLPQDGAASPVGPQSTPTVVPPESLSQIIASGTNTSQKGVPIPTTEGAPAAQAVQGQTSPKAIQDRAKALYMSGEKDAANKLLADNNLPTIVQPEEAKVGNMVMYFKPGAKKPLTSETIKTPTGSVVVKPEEDKVAKDWETVKTNSAEVNNKAAGFAQWAADMTKKGQKIDFGTPDKDGVYYPKSVNGEQYGYKKEKTVGNKVEMGFEKLGVTKETVKAWGDGQAALENLKGKGIQVEFQQPKYTQEQLANTRQLAIDKVNGVVAKDPKQLEAELKTANEAAAKIGFDAIRPDELKGPKKTETPTADVNETLKSLNLPPMSEKDIAKARKNPIMKAAEYIGEKLSGGPMVEKRYLTSQLDFFTKEIKDPDINPRIKLQYVDKIKELNKKIDDVDKQLLNREE